MNRIIYQPNGRAREYSEWAANLYEGCLHGCTYCFGPDLPAHQGTREEYHARQVPKQHVVERIRDDVAYLQRNHPGANVLISFTSDPYPPDEALRIITQQCLLQFGFVGFAGPAFTVLTKGGARAIEDFCHYEPGHDVFASSIVFVDDDLRQQWEPDAAPLSSRWAAIEAAHERDIDTWISVEPVIDPDEALAVVQRAADTGVGHVRVGPLNHHSYAATVDWRRFGADLAKLLARTEIGYYIKQDLRPHMPSGFGPFDTREGASDDPN